jgi:hypothetical protein
MSKKARCPQNGQRRAAAGRRKRKISLRWREGEDTTTTSLHSFLTRISFVHRRPKIVFYFDFDDVGIVRKPLQSNARESK